MTTKRSLGLDPDTGAEKFVILDDNGNEIGYDYVYTE